MEARQRDMIDQLQRHAESSVHLVFTDSARWRLRGIAEGLRQAVAVIEGEYRDPICQSLKHNHDYCQTN